MSNSDRVVVVAGARTPFARARTVFAKMSPAALGGITLRETVARSGIDPKLIDEIYYGIVSPPAEGSNVSREALFDSGLPPQIPCTTVNRYCASSAEATAGIVAKIMAGQIAGNFHPVKPCLGENIDHRTPLLRADLEQDRALGLEV